MAFRIAVGHGLLVEADTAGDVKALLGELGIGGPKLLEAARPPALEEVIVDDEIRPPRRTPTAKRVAHPRKGAAPAVGRPDPAGSSDRAAKILQAVQDGTSGGGISGAAIAKAMKLSVWTVREQLQQLATRGLVHVTGDGRGQRWHMGAKGAGRTSAKEDHSR